jgi:LacI family transcriptional regulator
MSTLPAGCEVLRVSRQVTSFDVARLAGVSQPTVSRALRNLSSVSPETKDRVRAAAAQLSYLPSYRGRALSTQTTRRVAVVSEELTNPFYPELVEPIRLALKGGAYATVVMSDAAGALTVEELADGSFDGVILTTSRRNATLPQQLVDRAIPHVLVNRVVDGGHSASVSIDNVMGGALLGNLLARLGHRRIASIEGPHDTSTGRDRALGLQRGLANHGLFVPAELRRSTTFNHDAGRACARELLSMDRSVSAIACGNDVQALGSLSAARELGIAVPSQLTIVGFDDIPMAGWPLISLTTVRCDLRVLGRLTVQLLLRQMESGVVQRHRRVLTPTLVLRDSHAPPAGRRPV